MISFKTTKEEAILIGQIVARAQREIFSQCDVKYSALEMTMDLSACIAQGCRLKLSELLCAAPFDFAHDILGIRRHLDRHEDSPTAGKLLNCFVPRYTAYP